MLAFSRLQRRCKINVHVKRVSPSDPSKSLVFHSRAVMIMLGTIYPGRESVCRFVTDNWCNVTATNHHLSQKYIDGLSPTKSVNGARLARKNAGGAVPPYFVPSLSHKRL